ncbi:MAG: hypothetical protein HRT56_04720, partial [Coraliomargarita sp.]|nr:hypothetical protein [Coraliomargarita sp.]
MNSTPSVFGVDPLRPAESPEDADRLQREIDARTINQSMDLVREKLQEDFKAGRASQTDVMQLLIASDTQDRLVQIYERELEYRKSGKPRGALSINALEALSPREMILVALAEAPTYLLKKTKGAGTHVNTHQLGAYLGRRVDTEVRLKELEALPDANRDFKRLQKQHDAAARSPAYRAEINRRFIQDYETEG